jgi:hypothetical protein
MKTTTNNKVNTNFLKEWQPFDKLNKMVKRKILTHFINNVYNFQPTHDKTQLKPFHPVTFSQVDNILGLAYTSTGDYAGLWVCNGGYLQADKDHHFIGFAINTEGEVIAIADDENEKSIYIKI